MSTFFEKLTGSHTQSASPLQQAEPEKIEEPVEKPRPQKRIAASEKSRPTQLKVEHEETPVPQPEYATAEEDGELTVDIYDRGDAIVIQSTVAGVKPEDLDISITADTITIRGKRARNEEISEKNYYYKELFWGTFSRTVILPEEIDDTAAEASMKNGLLQVVLPKKKRIVTQKLKVKVS